MTPDITPYLETDLWFDPVLKNDRFPNAIHVNGVVIATDGRRLHAEVGAEVFLTVDPSDDTLAKLLIILDGDRYREISEPDLWEPYEEGGARLRAHMFEDVVLDKRFLSEAVAGLGRYTCAVCKDNPCASPVRFRSLDGRREAYIMPYRVRSQC